MQSAPTKHHIASCAELTILFPTCFHVHNVETMSTPITLDAQVPIRMMCVVCQTAHFMYITRLNPVVL